MKLKPLYLSSLIVALGGGLAMGQGDDRVKPEAGVGGSLKDQEQLGQLLFHDSRLSEPAGQSCASCHDANLAFTDPDKWTPTSQGVNPQLFGSRNTPSAMYMAFSPAFHFDAEEGLYAGGGLDGRAATLEEQAKGPFLNPLEMANTSKQQVVDKVRDAPYAPLFTRMYGANVFSNAETAYDRSPMPSPPSSAPVLSAPSAPSTTPIWPARLG